MKAVIMAGGKGERLNPFTHILPKPLLPIGETPIIELILKRISEKNIDEVILTTNYKAHLFEIILGKNKQGMEMHYSKEEKPLGTAGPLSILKNKLTEDFIVMNGDILTDLDVTELSKFHFEQKADITVVTKTQEIPLSYGMVILEGENIVGWKEKPMINSEISTGIYMIKPSVLECLKENEKADMPELIKKVIEKKGKVIRFHYKGRWIDIGKIEDYERAQKEIINTFKDD